MFHISTQRPILTPILHSSVLTSQVRNPMYTLSVLTSQVRNPLYTPCSHFSSQKPIVHSMFCIGMLCLITASLQLRPIYGCGQSTVMAILRLRPIYSYGRSTVTANLWLQPIYGCSTLFCYYGLSAHHSYSYATFREYALSGCNFSSIVYLQ